MIARGRLVAALVGVQIVVLVTAVVAVRGFPERDRSELVADGGPQTFAVGSSPRLEVNIGYADVRILADRTSDIVVNMGAGDSRALFRDNGPIVTSADGNTLRIDARNPRDWSTGDDRIVFVIVPPATQVTVLRAGDITANGLRAVSTFHSVGQGTISIDGYAAPTLHVASSGPITLNRIVTANLDAQSDDRITGTALDVRNGSVKGGDRVALSFVPNADTLVSDDAGGDDGAPRTLRLGAGAGHIDVRADGDDISLRKEP